MGRYTVKVKDVGSYFNRCVNIIGIVVEFSIPCKSNGSDYCTILKIIDQSQNDHELCVNVFMTSINALPHIRAHKDIILLCNVRIENYEQNPFVIFCKTSSFALFDGRVSDDFRPYQVSPTFQLVDSDKDSVRRMRNWSQINSFDAGISQHVVSLEDIEGKAFVDLVCKVLHVCEVSSGKWMLFVWDGTDAPPISINTKITDEDQNALLLQIEPVRLPEDVLRNFPHVGTVLRIVADEVYEELGVHFQIVGNWVRMRNLQCKTKSGLWKGVLTPATKCRPLSEKDNSVIDRLRACNERILERGRIPSTASLNSDILTVTGNERVGFATLLDLLLSPLLYGGYKCVVRVVAVYPSQTKDFRSPVGNYRIRMTLEDPTARIHALLCLENAEEFFCGYPDVDTLTNKMNRLLGVEGCEFSPRNPPWVHCCIGFHSSDESDAIGSRDFHVCNTRLVA
ncbi:Protection of telomeres protein 1b [Forsythia ovata]|uniref:Protection of telomeres protein 1 n=1 Tax=Forsythia ovata TaxID=205694 RepID=A0ABD1NZD7_9LAMI